MLHMLKGKERGNGQKNYSQITGSVNVTPFRAKGKIAQARNRTGGPTMATLDFTTKPLARSVVWE